MRKHPAAKNLLIEHAPKPLVWSRNVRCSLAMSALGVRRAKVAFFSGCKSHPATIAPAGSNRSSHGGNEVAEASGVEGHIW